MRTFEDVRWDCVASCMLEFWNTPLYWAPVNWQWSVHTLNFVASYLTVRSSCKKSKLHYFSKKSVLFMHMLFLSGNEGGVFRLLCFYKLSRYFSVRIGYFLILIAIHKGFLQSGHPSTETLTHWNEHQIQTLLDIERNLRSSICL